jgi:hypothetical protein
MPKSSMITEAGELVSSVGQTILASLEFIADQRGQEIDRSHFAGLRLMEFVGFRFYRAIQIRLRRDVKPVRWSYADPSRRIA